VDVLVSPPGLRPKRLAELEQKTDVLTVKDDGCSRKTRAQLKQVFDALR
jgi:hypothetical protein